MPMKSSISTLLPCPVPAFHHSYGQSGEREHRGWLRNGALAWLWKRPIQRPLGSVARLLDFDKLHRNMVVLLCELLGSWRKTSCFCVDVWLGLTGGGLERLFCSTHQLSFSKSCPDLHSGPGQGEMHTHQNI